MRNKLLPAILFSAALFLIQGCSTSSRTTKEETVTSVDKNGGYVNESTQNSASDNNRTERTEVKNEHVETEHRGILGTTFHFIGEVLAFPFKLVASVIEAIF